PAARGHVHADDPRPAGDGLAQPGERPGAAPVHLLDPTALSRARACKSIAPPAAVAAGGAIRLEGSIRLPSDRGRRDSASGWESGPARAALPRAPRPPPRPRR